MERAPPPALAAAALAMMDEELTDTPLSPKRPRQDDPPSQVGTGAGEPRPRTTENGENTTSMLVVSMQHTQATTHSLTRHTTPVGRSIREGLRAWTLHSRGTALALRREVPARHQDSQNPKGGMTYQNMGPNMEQMWTPWRGAKDSTGEGTKGKLPNAADGPEARRVADAQSTDTTLVKEAQHNKHQHKQEPTQNTQHTQPLKKGDTDPDPTLLTDPNETRPHMGLTTLLTPATQVALLDEDLEPMPEEEAEFPIDQKIIISFTAYEKGHKAKDEEEGRKPQRDFGGN